MARFFIIAGMAWYLKPLAGTLSDYFPIFGTRRYSYILGGSAALALLWIALGLGARTPGLMLGATTVLGTVLAICHATVSALVVEGGRMFAATGRLSTVRRVAEQVAAVAAGPAGGLLAMYSFVVTGVACGALALCLIAVVILFPPAEDLEPPRKSWAELREGLGVLLAARPMWCTSTLFFLLSFSPGFQTPLFYYQTNMLGFSPRFIGTLTLLGSAMSIAGTVPYPWLSRRVGLRPLMIVSIVLDALIPRDVRFLRVAGECGRYQLCGRTDPWIRLDADSRPAGTVRAKGSRGRRLGARVDPRECCGGDIRPGRLLALPGLRVELSHPGLAEWRLDSVDPAGHAPAAAIGHGHPRRKCRGAVLRRA